GSGGARIHDLCGLARDQRLDITGVAHALSVQHGCEMTLAAPPGRAIFKRTTLCLPFLQAAVENAYALMPHGAKHPPNARRRVEALAVIEEDLHVAAASSILPAAG